MDCGTGRQKPLGGYTLWVAKKAEALSRGLTADGLPHCGGTAAALRRQQIQCGGSRAVGLGLTLACVR
jgi:hypothetical protein